MTLCYNRKPARFYDPALRDAAQIKAITFRSLWDFLSHRCRERIEKWSDLIALRKRSRRSGLRGRTSGRNASSVRNSGSLDIICNALARCVVLLLLLTALPSGAADLYVAADGTPA